VLLVKIALGKKGTKKRVVNHDNKKGGTTGSFEALDLLEAPIDVSHLVEALRE